jgi:putative signal transducing protein
VTRDRLNDDPAADALHGPWTRVGSFLRDEEARLLAGRLNAEGIPARTYPEEVSSYYGTATGALLVHGIDVLVPEERVLEARELIERIARDG